MTSKKTMDVRALLQQQRRPRAVVTICLRGDLTSEIYRLDRELVEIGKGQPNDERLSGNTEAKRIAEQIKKLEAEAKAASIDVTLEALERKAWADLVAKHPTAIKGQDFDDSIFNDAIPACIVEPEMDDETRDKFLNGLTQGQWDELAGATHMLNAGDGAVPFSRLASKALRGSDED